MKGSSSHGHTFYGCVSFCIDWSCLDDWITNCFFFFIGSEFHQKKKFLLIPQLKYTITKTNPIKDGNGRISEACGHHALLNNSSVSKLLPHPPHPPIRLISLICLGSIVRHLFHFPFSLYTGCWISVRRKGFRLSAFARTWKGLNSQLGEDSFKQRQKRMRHGELSVTLNRI